jgi:hypothetical protein
LGNKTKYVPVRDDTYNAEVKGSLRPAYDQQVKGRIITVDSPKEIEVYQEVGEGKEVQVGKLMVGPNDVFSTEQTWIKMLRMAKGYNVFKKNVVDAVNAGKLTPEQAKELFKEQ